MNIPPADEIEIVPAEDPPRLPWPVPDTTLLSELDLPIRALNALRYVSEDRGLVLETVGDLRRVSDFTFLRLPNVGRRTMWALREACGDDYPHNEKKHRQRLDEVATRPLQYPPAIHVHLDDGHVYRIDALTLEQARQVIVRLCDDLEILRHKKGTRDVFRPAQ